MTSITWASPRYVQELTTILAPQNRTQGSCDLLSQILLKPLKLVGIAKTRTLDTGIMFECKEIKY